MVKMLGLDHYNISRKYFRVQSKLHLIQMYYTKKSGMNAESCENISQLPR